MGPRRALALLHRTSLLKHTHKDLSLQVEKVDEVEPIACVYQARRTNLLSMLLPFNCEKSIASEFLGRIGNVPGFGEQERVAVDVGDALEVGEVGRLQVREHVEHGCLAIDLNPFAQPIAVTWIQDESYVPEQIIIPRWSTKSVDNRRSIVAEECVI